MKRAHILVLVLVVGLILTAELLRNSQPRTATVVSMIAWSLFAAAFLVWAFRGSGWRSALRELGAIAVLSLSAGLVLLVYYVRSGTLAAGVHVDAAYSYIGLTWFTELRDPITFVATNPSYIQLPLMVLSHLPALAIGFHRLGAFSCLLGTLLQVSILLAVMARLFVPRALGIQALTAALAAAVFSDRMLVLSYNNFGYTIPAICLGLLFLVVVDDESIPDPDRIVGGLLSLSLLHHYSGFTQVLPLVLVWLLLRRGGLGRLPGFFARNAVLVAVGAMFLVTLALRPELILRRIKDVTVGTAPGPLPPVIDELVAKALKNWSYLVGPFPKACFRALFIENQGSWTYLNIPPLGGLVVPLVAGAWMLAALSLRGRRARYLVYLVSFVSGLLALAVLQHLLTDFGDYRNLTPIYALLVSGLLFVFRAPRLGPGMKVAAVCYAVLVAAYNYADLANLHGRVFLSGEYARLSQQTMEGLAGFLRRRSPAEIGVARIHVVLDSVFPLGEIYMKELARYGVPIHVIDAKDLCADPGGVIDAASSKGCDGFLLVTHSERCPERNGTAGDGPATVAAYVYHSVCGRPDAGLADRPLTLLDIQTNTPLKSPKILERGSPGGPPAAPSS